MFEKNLVKYPFKDWTSLTADIDMYSIINPSPKDAYEPVHIERSSLGPMVIKLEYYMNGKSYPVQKIDVITDVNYGYINVKDFVLTTEDHYANDHIITFGLRFAAE